MIPLRSNTQLNSKKHDTWLLSLKTSNTTLTFNYYKNLDVKNVVNYSKTKQKITTIFIHQNKLITCDITKNKNF